MPYLIPDCPIVASMERTGRPPWDNLPRSYNPFSGGYEWDDEDFDEEESDEYYGNETASF